MAAEIEGYVLDACALIAFLQKEPGAEKVADLLTSDVPVFMASVNLLEVCYDLIRREGIQAAEEFLEDVRRLPIKLISELSHKHLLASARWKSGFRVSLADAIALGLAEIMRAHVVTSDHHEFDPIEKAGLMGFTWIR